MKKSLTRTFLLLLVAALIFWLTPASGGAAPKSSIEPDDRCPVCGMFVAKYEVWITQIRYDQTTVFCFDGVKDMMAFYHDPGAYNGPDRSGISEIWVKDYYTLQWLDGRQAFFVIGSDVHGPMGHELIPFASREAAESFLADHHGREILPFDEINAATVERLRSGSRMKNMKK